MTKIAINGLGRIGCAALKITMDTPELELLAVNDVVPIENIVYPLKYDTVYGRKEGLIYCVFVTLNLGIGIVALQPYLEPTWLTLGGAFWNLSVA